MAKRVIWTKTARDARREILEYWIARNRSNTYSKKLLILFKEKIARQTKHQFNLPSLNVVLT